MRIKPEQIPKTMNFLQRDFPALVCLTAKIDDTDEYWQDVIDKVEYVSKKYDRIQFVNHMLLAYLDYLEQQRDEKRRK